ncbi:zf-CCHC domain-containing protein [Tanacetum coccineum]|uniref:Zf-CCHC domain-containing protein n=1 Tax=Tanacetum coccineum TaxID=301880 RepID=A0ABQ5DWE9_9ASTR
MAIEESKDFTSLSLDELIGNLKVHEVLIKKDSEIVKGKREQSRSLALKAKTESSDEESSTSGSEDKEYAMSVRDFKKVFKRRDLLVQQYEQFTIPEEESIDNAFARFNTIITCLKALDESFSSKNYARKFLRALHSKWRGKVMAIEESKYFTSLSLDKVIGNLKVYEVLIKKYSKIVKGKREQSRSLALKAKTISSDEESSTPGSEDEEYAMTMRDFKNVFKIQGRFVTQPRDEKKSFQRNRDDKNGKSKRKCFRCGDPNHLIEECPKPPRNKSQRAFVGGSWRDSGKYEEENTKDDTCFIAQAFNEVLSETDLYSDDLSSIMIVN